MICPNCGGYIGMDASDISGCCDTCNTHVEAGQLVSDEAAEEIESKSGQLRERKDGAKNEDN